MKNTENFLGIYENAFEQNFCNSFINYIDLLKERTVLVKNSQPDHIIDDYGINFVHHYDLKSWSWLGEQFFPVVQNYVNDYIQKYSILSKQSFLMYDIKAKKIEVGGGFHDWHYENNKYATTNRVLVVQLYLNTIEEGGETEFLYLNKRVSAEQGKLLIFPAGFTHTHRGNPPLEKEKYIVSSWVLLQENI